MTRKIMTQSRRQVQQVKQLNEQAYLGELPYFASYVTMVAWRSLGGVVTSKWLRPSYEQGTIPPWSLGGP